MSETTDLNNKPRRKNVLDVSAITVSVVAPGSDPAAYDLRTLPTETRDYLSLRGFLDYARDHNGEAAALDLLRNRGAAVMRPSQPKPRGKLREAISHALVDLGDREGKPITLDNARALTAGWPREQVLRHRTDSNVLPHYARLTGKTSSLAEHLPG